MNKVRNLTFLDHTDSQTLLEATILASVSTSFVDNTISTRETHVLGVLLHSSLRHVGRK